MGNIITIKIPDTVENKAMVIDLLSVPGVVIESGKSGTGPAVSPVDDGIKDKSGRPGSRGKGAGDDGYLTLRQMAEMVGRGYYTVRRWVVDQQVIPSHRPGGSQTGSIVVQKKDVVALMAGKRVGSRRFKKRGVKIL